MTLNRRSFLFRVPAAPLAAALLGGCVEMPLAPLRIGINAWVGYDPLVLARDQGGVDAQVLRIIDTFSNTDSLRALSNGLLDGAALTLDEALRLADGGLPVVIIAMINQSEGADAVLARPDVLQASDLRGRVIGLEKTALGAVVLEQLLQEGSLRPNEVSTLHVEAAQHADMMRAGRVDGRVDGRLRARRGVRALGSAPRCSDVNAPGDAGRLAS